MNRGYVHRHFAKAIVAAVLTLSAGEIHAQVVSDSLLNQRVRIHLARQSKALEGAAGRQAFRGILTRIDSDSIAVLIHPEAAPVSVSSHGIYQVDVSRGVSPSRTALRRGVGGALVWAALGSLGPEEIGGGPLENSLIWAGGGFVVGAVIGSLFPEEHWIRVFRR